MFNFFIKTAATAMLQGESQKHAMRDVEIMSDTAYRTGLKSLATFFTIKTKTLFLWFVRVLN